MGYRRQLELDFLRDLLLSKGGIYVYKVPARYKISIKSLFTIIHKYREYIEYSDGLIKVIEGQEGALNRRYFPQKSEKASTGNNIVVPTAFIGPQIGIDDFYCPKELLNNQEEPAF